MCCEYLLTLHYNCATEYMTPSRENILMSVRMRKTSLFMKIVNYILFVGYSKTLSETACH